MFRSDSNEINKYWPIMIKAKESGVLETLLTETEKLITGHYQINIIQTGVGPITEADLNCARDTGAVIFGFDIACPSVIENRIADSGVTVRLHKLIYKFTDDITDLVHDVKLAEQKAKGQGKVKDVQGTAQILQFFNVTTAGKKT